MSICGKKIITLPTPAITPSLTKLDIAPSPRTALMRPPSSAALTSITSMIGVAQAKTA